MKNISGHDWLIDGSLSHKELAECEDVSSSVEVSVQCQPTAITPIPDSFSIGFSDLPAGATGLAGVFGIDILDSFTQTFGFVGEELLELPESPSSEQLIEPPSVLFAPSDGQLFENEELRIARSDFLADTVVDIPHKPLFSSTKLPEMPLCGASAFSLELRFEPLVFAFDSTNLTAVEKLSVTCDDWIDDSSVNAECFNDLNLLNIGSFSHEIKDYSIAFDSKSSCGYLPTDIRLEVNRDFDWQFDTTKSCGHADYTILQEGCEGIVVESDARELLFDWQPLHLLPLEHVASLVSGCADITAVERGELLACSFVCGSVELELVESLEPEPFCHNIVTGLVVDMNCLCDSFVVRQNQLDCSLHPLVSYVKNKNLNFHKQRATRNSPHPLKRASPLAH